jgi:hypothetical protein
LGRLEVTFKRTLIPEEVEMWNKMKERVSETRLNEDIDKMKWVLENEHLQEYSQILLFIFSFS